MQPTDGSVYLDNAATTPLDPRALEAMRPFLEGPDGFANASSLHSYGQQARAAVEEARAEAAAALGVEPGEVLFTAGGTESDNTAVKGLAWAGRRAGRGDHVVTTAIEHPAVLESARWLGEEAGFAVDVVGCGPDGVVDAEQVLAAVGPQTVVVSVMAANNELGTLQPIDVLGPELAARGVPLHTDAVQAFGKAPLDLRGWQIPAASLSAHKFCGPKGVGILTLDRDLAVASWLHGGGQERGVRSGTLNVAGAVGAARAARLAAEEGVAEQARLAELRDRLLDGLLAVGGVSLNGSRSRRVPHNAHVAVQGCDGEALLLALDAAGVAVSTGSACQSGAAGPSHVLEAIGAPSDQAHLRLTLGRWTTAEDVEAAVAAFTEAVKRLRDAGGGFLP